MSRKRRYKPVCPKHDCPLEPRPTRFGKRWSCTYPGCTVAWWPGPTSLPADDETRRARHLCHLRFDPLWRDRTAFKPDGPKNARTKAYEWLAARLMIPAEKAHFGMFTIEQCRAAWLAMNSLDPPKKETPDDPPRVPVVLDAGVPRPGGLPAPGRLPGEVQEPAAAPGRAGEDAPGDGPAVVDRDVGALPDPRGRGGLGDG